MQSIRKSMLTGAVMAGVAAGLVAGPAAAADQALIDAAKKEGEVVWYTGMIVNQVVRPIVEGFKDKYGIDVKFTTTSDSQTLLRVTNEARAGQMHVDIFDSPGTVMPPLKEAGLLEAYVPATMGGYDDMFKQGFPYWSGIYALYLTTDYNTNLVKPEEAPKTFQDLLDPKWRGKMVWTDTRTISGPAGFIGNVLKTMGQDKGMAYLHELAKQDIVPVPANQRVVLDQVIAGQYAIGLMTYNHHAEISKAKGAPVDWIKMEPLVANLGVIAMVKNAPHPNAAKLFLDYLMSEDGQKVVSAAGYPPGHPDVKPKVPAISPLYGDFETTLLTPANTVHDLEGWLKIYDELFK